MSKKLELFEKVYRHHGSLLIVIKQRFVIKCKILPTTATPEQEKKFNSINKETNLFLYSFQIALKQNNNKIERENLKIWCSFYCIDSSKYHHYELVLTESGGNLIWDFVDGRNDDVEDNGEIYNSLIKVLIDGTFEIDNCKVNIDQKDFRDCINKFIDNGLTLFLPSKNEGVLFASLKEIFSSENVGIIANANIEKIFTDEENFYLSDNRIKDETKDEISRLLNEMILPTVSGEKFNSIELDGAFRISYT